jgi:transcription initiation factor TFIIH subunit 2
MATGGSAADTPVRPEDRQSALALVAAILEKDSVGGRNEMHVWEQALDKTWDKIDVRFFAHFLRRLTLTSLALSVFSTHMLTPTAMSSLTPPQDSLASSEDPTSMLARARARKLAMDARCDVDQAERAAVVQKGLLRNLVVVMDLSRSSESKDLRPTRRSVMLSSAEALVREFFDQNPVSNLALVGAYDLRAARLAPLTGSPGVHIAALRALARHGGDFSLQNALHVAAGSLEHVPAHGTREVLLCVSSLFTADASDIDATIALLQRLRVRVSVVGAGAAVHVYSRVAAATGGTYTVATSAEHWRQTVLSHVEPASVQDAPPTAAAAVAAAGAAGTGRRWVAMGFPVRVACAADGPSSTVGGNAGTSASSRGGGGGGDGSSGESNVLICACHGRPVAAAHSCPRCSALVCELPCECPICALALASAPHLARSYHHLFPLPRFADVTDNAVAAATAAATTGDAGVAAAGASVVCDGCARALAPARGDLLSQCPVCQSRYCGDCDELVHTALHNCPGCLAAAEGAPASEDDDG